MYEQHMANLSNLITDQNAEISNMSAQDLKNYNLPLARVKKIMKSDEDVRMISAEAPILFSKA
jgi:nuclear transcription factor Y gamma